MNKKKLGILAKFTATELTKDTSVYATIRATSSPKIKSKISKLMPFKKSSSRTTQAGDFEDQEL